MLKCFLTGRWRIFAAFCLLTILPGYSQNIRPAKPAVPTTRILFIFDASNSMHGTWQSDTKYNIAVKILSSILDSLKNKPNLELALRVYGHQKKIPPQDCDDSKLEVPFGSNNAMKIQLAFNTIVPKGTTPIAKSLSLAAKDFSPCRNCRNVIILITDGIEECGGDPCEVSRELQKQGIVLKPFVIGIGRDFRNEFECVGRYFDATSEKELQTALNVIITRTLNPTTMQVNLLDTDYQPTETNVNMTFYDMETGNVKYNLVHTLNARGLPDTLDVDPLLQYRIVAHTIPPVTKDSVKIIAGTHNIIGLDTPQGSLSFRTNSTSTIKFMPCIIRKHGDPKTLYVQQFDQTEQYITGLYDVEILCLPRLISEGVDIRQSQTTTIEIPLPGTVMLEKPSYGYGSLLLDDPGKGLILLYTLKDNADQKETLYLLPGNYRAVFRSRQATRAFSTVEKQFRVESGKTLHIKF